VLEELIQGHSNKEIARSLDMTEHTVKYHLKNIFSKLKVERRGQAIAKARELGLG
jgi:LuxR family maltose regulon positive regulatory protein